ncbi:hypothetical protein [Rhizobium rhizoryzae]|uniref:hypothetical protein n=1 Tax=Rhizobium rhizoryzae TaxID=451876 RepID=UPI00289A0DB8|nr:hypothetical protein [Rhizobium rhizoryzae]
MPSFSEVKLYVLGLWLLVKGDRAGLALVDFTDRGMMRSFWAIVWCIPAIGFSWIWWRLAFLETMPPGFRLGGIFFFRMALLEASNWLVPLVLAGLMALTMGLARQFPAIVFTANWLSVPFSYLYGLLSILLVLMPGLTGLIALIWLGAIVALVVCLSRIFRMIIGPQTLTVATLTMVLIVPSLLLSDVLERFLGVYPG